MAIAKKIVLPLPPVVPKYNVVLTLDKNEAETLLALTSKVGGAPEETRRRFVDGIRQALILADVQQVNAHTLANCGSIWFTYEEIA